MMEVLFNRVFCRKIEFDDFTMDIVYGKVLFVCHTCATCLKIVTMLPSMEVANGLQLLPVPENLELSELENNLIGCKTFFRKIFQLPKSKTAALNDKLVNIPIHENDVLLTLKSNWGH